MKVNKRKVLTLVLFVMLLVALLLVVTMVLSAVVIGRGVDERCEQARKKYDGDCGEAMIALVQSEDESFRDRNQGIWVLGQLGDDRALPVLESMYTGNIPERESYDEGISQYELKKAIALTSGGFNVTAVVWR